MPFDAQPAIRKPSSISLLPELAPAEPVYRQEKEGVPANFVGLALFALAFAIAGGIGALITL